MRVKLLLHNVQDLFFRLAYPLSPADIEQLNEAEWQLMAPSDLEMKPLHRLRGLARVIRDEAPDVALLCEVGGGESLANFNHWFLDDAYDMFLTPGVSDRGIDTAFLVRKGFAFRAEIRSHWDTKVSFLYPHEVDPIGYDVTAMIASTFDLGKPEERRLSRDVPELRLYAREVDGQRETLVAAILLAHLKSGYDPIGIDPSGAVRRAAEVRALLQVRAATQLAAGPDVPVIVAGDLNGRAARDETAAEFLPLYAETDLEDVLELAGREPWERVTHVTFFRGTGRAGQLDYVLLPRSLHERLDRTATYVHRFKDETGAELAFPGSMRDRATLPSDHYPVVCVVDLG